METQFVRGENPYRSLNVGIHQWLRDKIKKYAKGNNWDEADELIEKHKLEIKIAQVNYNLNLAGPIISFNEQEIEVEQRDDEEIQDLWKRMPTGFDVEGKPITQTEISKAINKEFNKSIDSIKT